MSIYLQEQIDLEDLVFQVRLDEERMRSQQLQDADLYVIIIIKKPLVAIRYRLSDGQVRSISSSAFTFKLIFQIRRLQLNFRPESGYDVAVKALKALGLPIRNKNNPPEALAPEPNASGYLPPSSLRSSPIRTPSQSQEQITYANYHHNHGSQCARSSMDMMSSLIMIRHGQTIYAQSVGSFAAQRSTTIEAAAALNRPAANLNSNPFMHNPASSSLLPSPDFVTRATTSDGFVVRPPSSAPEVQPQRPTTAPLSLSQMLPPKRELPFPKKKEKPKSPAKEPDEQPLSSSLDPLQRKTTPPKAIKQRKSRAKTTKPKPPVSSSAPKAASKIAEPELQSSPPEIPTVPPQAESSYRLPASEAKIPRSDPLVEAPVPSSDTLVPSSPPHHVTDKASTAPENVPRKAPKKPAKKKTVEEQTPKIFGDAAPDEIMDRLDHWVRKYQDLPAPKLPQTPAENLAAYAAQPEQTRLAVIDDMIVKCLGDENFIKLVEDVDKSWKRIGLGF